MSEDETHTPAPGSAAPAAVHPAQGDVGEVAFAPGELVDGRYRIEGSVGRGGVGRVYRALQLKLDRPVAIKVLLDESLGEDSQRPRFEREAMALAALSHPNIVGVQDYGIWRGRPFLVMELLEGRSLRGRLDLGALSQREALRVTRDLLHGLAYAHARGVVHRDLKPANVFLQSFPTQLDHVKILDFGFAKFVDNNVLASAPALTKAGMTVGSPAYMSPERLYGSEVDGRADLYSVGVLLFEMLSGTKPFDGEISDVLRAHLVSPVPKLEDRRAGLDPTGALQQVVERALQKEPAQRYSSAGAMLSAIEALQQAALIAAVREGAGIEATPEPPTAGTSLPVLASTGRALRRSLAPLARRLPSGDRLRSMGDVTWQRTRLGAQQLRRWLEHGVRWTAPRLREGTRQLGAQWQRLRARGASSAPGADGPDARSGETDAGRTDASTRPPSTPPPRP